MCLSYWSTSGQNFSKIEHRGMRAKKNKKIRKGRFMDTESIQETLKIFNFTTTYATLIKLTTENQIFGSILTIS